MAIDLPKSERNETKRMQTNFLAQKTMNIWEVPQDLPPLPSDAPALDCRTFQTSMHDLCNAFYRDMRRADINTHQIMMPSDGCTREQPR